MKYCGLMCLIVLLSLLSACKMGIYHVSEQPTGDGIYLMKVGEDCAGRITYESFNNVYRSGRYPDVSPDKALLFVKPVANNSGDPVFQQVWRENELLTRTPGDKRYPHWSPRWFAYEHDTGAGGKKIVVQSYDNRTVFTLSPQVDGGLDFFDNGQKIVFTRADGIYWIAAIPNAVENRIASCGPSPSGCKFPVVSHDGSLLAFRITTALLTRRIETIEIVRTGTWQHVSTVTLQPPADMRGVYSFDFSPDDRRLIVAAESTDVTVANPHNRLELFCIKIDGTDQKRLTNNQIPDYSPSTFRILKP